MASAGLCFSLSLAPCENQIVLCLKRKRWKRFCLYSHFWKIWLCFEKKKSFQWLDFECYCWGGKLLEGMLKKISAEWTMLNFFFLAALNPIRSLIRVMHRDFTLQVGFFWVLLGSRMGLKLDTARLKAGSLMWSEGSCAPVSHWNCLGSTDELLCYLWMRGRPIIWHCGEIGFSGGTNYLISHEPLPPPLTCSSRLLSHFSKIYFYKKIFSLIKTTWCTLNCRCSIVQVLCLTSESYSPSWILEFEERLYMGI